MNHLLNGAPVRIIANNAPVDAGFLPRGWDGLKDPVLVAASTGYPSWVERSALTPAPEWSFAAPTKPGRYHWRKNYQWEPIVREVREVDGELRTYSERFVQWVPLKHLEAYGSEWLVADVVAGGVR